MVQCHVKKFTRISNNRKSINKTQILHVNCVIYATRNIHGCLCTLRRKIRTIWLGEIIEFDKAGVLSGLASINTALDSGQTSCK